MLDVIRSNAQSWGVKLAFGIIIVVFVFWGVGGLSGGPTTVILEVNGEPVTMQDFQRRYEKYEQEIRSQYPDLDPTMLKSLKLKQQVIQQLILEALITQEATRLGVMVTPVELRKTIEGLPYFHNAEGVFDAETYLRMLKAQNDTAGHFEKQVRNTLLMGKLQKDVTAGAYISEAEVRELYMYDGERRILEYVLFPLSDYLSKVNVTPEEIQSYYDANQSGFSIPPQADVEYLLIGAEALAPLQVISDAMVAGYYEKNAGQYTQPEQVHARHILILAAEKAGEEELAKAKAEIESLEKRLSQGKEDFAKLAQEFSQDGSAAQGGDLGWFAREQMVAPFADAAFALKPGEVSKPVKTQFG
ncbi:MAG: SurA N-terminal domain-containing protein, partial [Bilophila sp.]